MIGFALLFANYARIRAVVIACFAALHVSTPDAPAIADAIASAVAADDSPVWDDAELEAAAMAVFVVYESAGKLHPRPYLDPRTGLPIDGLAHGAFQIHGPAGLADIGTQARAFLAMLHDGAEICPENHMAPANGGCIQARRPADRRLALARKILGELQQEETNHGE